MAVTTEKSTQITNSEAKPRVPLAANDWSGKLRVARFDFTQGAAAGDANSTVDMVRLPAGSVRVYLAMSRITTSAFGSSRTLDIGHTAYTGFDGATVAADEDDLDAAQSISGAASYVPIGTVGGDETKLFESHGDGVLIQAKCEGGTIPIAATINGYFVYAVE